MPKFIHYLGQIRKWYFIFFIMEKLFEEFQNRKIQDQIITHKVYSEKILSNFSLFLINENHHLLHPLLKRENKQKIIIINAFEYLNNTFFMICFENLLVLIPDNCLKIIKNFFSIEQIFRNYTLNR